MQKIVTRGIVLTRINYGEADRIITVLTPDSGKLRLMAKGVRKLKSKLAGGVELFSVSSLTFIPGRGDIGTLVSSRLEAHYGRIVKDLDRTNFTYEALRLFNKITEDEAEEGYFDLLASTLEALDELELNLIIIRLWLYAQLLLISGHAPNLHTDQVGVSLDPKSLYNFSFEEMAFAAHPQGPFSAKHIKLIRFALVAKTPSQLAQVQEAEQLFDMLQRLVKTMLSTSVRTN